MSEPESELNAAYGEMYTTVASREKRTKEWVSFPVINYSKSGLIDAIKFQNKTYN